MVSLLKGEIRSPGGRGAVEFLNVYWYSHYLKQALFVYNSVLIDYYFVKALVWCPLSTRRRCQWAYCVYRCHNWRGLCLAVTGLGVQCSPGICGLKLCQHPSQPPPPAAEQSRGQQNVTNSRNQGPGLDTSRNISLAARYLTTLPHFATHHTLYQDSGPLASMECQAIWCGQLHVISIRRLLCCSAL